MVESFILNLFFTIGLLFGVISSSFLPLDVYLPWLNYSNVGFVSSVGTAVITAPVDIVTNSGEYYEKVRHSWSKIDSTISDTVVYTASCSMGLLVGGNIGHKIRTKVTESLKEIGKKCDALKTKLKEEKRKLSEIQGKTRADEIKRIIGNRSGDGVEKLNFDSRKLAKEIKSLIERYTN